MNEKIEYWLDYWEDLASGEEAQIFPLKMMNPRTILLEFADEIEFNKLANKNNRKFFTDIIKRYAAHDPGIQACLKEIFTLITREFEKPRESYLLQLCKEAQRTFDSLEYFNASIDALKSILLTSKPLTDSDKENISILTKDIFIELMEIGYSKKYVENIPRKLFSDYEVINNQIITEFPHQIPFPQEDNPDVTFYNEQVKRKLDSLSDADRVEGLKAIGRSELEPFTYIFEIRGLRGASELRIGPVLFYSPMQKKLVLDETLRQYNELFGAKDVNSSFLNAAVCVSAREPFSGLTHAKSLIVSALSVLRFNYQSQANYHMGPSYTVIRENGKVAASSSNADKSSLFWVWQDSLELTEDMVNKTKPKLEKSAEALFHESISGNDIDRRIAASMHWYRRAMEAETGTDSLLWYWITIENLLQKDQRTANIVLKPDQNEGVIDIALELLPRIRSKNIAYQKGWRLRHKVLLLLNNGLIKIVPEVTKRAGLQGGDRTIYLEPFVKSIPEIVKYIGRQLLIDQLNNLHSFYSNSDYALQSLMKERESARDELLLIYRMRNKIVHNAEYETSMLPFAIASIRQFSGGLLSGIIRVRSEKGIRTAEEALSDILCEFDIFMENIKTTPPQTVLFKS